MRLALLSLLASTALADTPKRVVVLYFDNNTNQKDLDVLSKGLADMLVTDLSAVESLQVVEREKLQALIDELKLQRSKYFDPKTAQKLGKVAGAEYAVTGAFAALEPKMRIDIRLVEVATAKLVVADKVIGDKGAFFDLQQELVDRFVHALNVKLRASARARSGVADIDTLLKYSKSIDAADKGDLAGASKALAEVVRSAPDFKLAHERYAELLRRLEAAGAKRSDILSALEREVLEACEKGTRGGLAAVFPPGPKGESEQAFRRRYGERSEALRRHLGYRAAKVNLYFNKLVQRFQGQANTMSMTTVVPLSQRSEVQELMMSFYSAAEQAIAERKELLAREVHMPYGWLLGSAADEEMARYEKLGVRYAPHLSGDSLAQLEADVAYFALLGGTNPAGSFPGYFFVRPALAEMDKSVARSAFAHLDSALQAAKNPRAADQKEGKLADPVKILDAYGEALLRYGRREEAVSRWQQALDDYPTHPQFNEIEKKLKELLCSSQECKDFEAALARCDQALMLKGPLYLQTLARFGGGPALRRVFDAAKRNCPEKDPNHPQSPYNVTQYSFLTQIASAAQGIGECPLFNEVLGFVRQKPEARMLTVAYDQWTGCR